MRVFLQERLGHVKTSFFSNLVVRFGDRFDHSGRVEVVVKVSSTSVAALIGQGDLAGTVVGRTNKDGVGR